MDSQEEIWKKLEKSIERNKRILEKLNKIDNEYYSFQIKTSKLIEIIKLKGQRKKESEVKGNNILVIHSGNPYLTLLLAIEAIQKEINITIDIQETMYGLNSGIVKIIQEILNEENVDITINLVRDTINEKDNLLKFDKIIVMGERDMYKLLKKRNLKQLSYNPSGNIEIYCDSEEFQEIEEMICEIADYNFMLMERQEECEKVEEVIEQINEYGEKDIVVILTKQNISKEELRKQIDGKYVYINENPYKQMEKDKIKEDYLNQKGNNMATVIEIKKLFEDCEIDYVDEYDIEAIETDKNELSQEIKSNQSMKDFCISMAGRIDIKKLILTCVWKMDRVTISTFPRINNSQTLEEQNRRKRQ